MVIDASAAIDLLLGIEPHAGSIARLVADEGPLAAPHLLDAEVGQVLRRLVASRALSLPRARGALDDLAALPIQRFAHGPLLARAFDLRHNTTVYDALHVVLAEGLRVPLLTRDRALAAIPGHRAKIIVLR
ncbi:MAG: type II toxin-antitoxin system VapC family toxin [Polyangia bacterium]